MKRKLLFGISTLAAATSSFIATSMENNGIESANNNQLTGIKRITETAYSTPPIQSFYSPTGQNTQDRRQRQSSQQIQPRTPRTSNSSSPNTSSHFSHFSVSSQGNLRYIPKNNTNNQKQKNEKKPSKSLSDSTKVVKDSFQNTTPPPNSSPVSTENLLNILSQRHVSPPTFSPINPTNPLNIPSQQRHVSPPLAQQSNQFPGNTLHLPDTILAKQDFSMNGMSSGFPQNNGQMFTFMPPVIPNQSNQQDRRLPFSGTGQGTGDHFGHSQHQINFINTTNSVLPASQSPFNSFPFSGQSGQPGPRNDMDPFMSTGQYQSSFSSNNQQQINSQNIQPFNFSSNNSASEFIPEFIPTSTNHISPPLSNMPQLNYDMGTSLASSAPTQTYMPYSQNAASANALVNVNSNTINPVNSQDQKHLTADYKEFVPQSSKSTSPAYSSNYSTPVFSTNDTNDSSEKASSNAVSESQNSSGSKSNNGLSSISATTSSPLLSNTLAFDTLTDFGKDDNKNLDFPNLLSPKDDIFDSKFPLLSQGSYMPFSPKENDEKETFPSSEPFPRFRNESFFSPLSPHPHDFSLSSLLLSPQMPEKSNTFDSFPPASEEQSVDKLSSELTLGGKTTSASEASSKRSSSSLNNSTNVSASVGRINHKVKRRRQRHYRQPSDREENSEKKEIERKKVEVVPSIHSSSESRNHFLDSAEQKKELEEQNESVSSGPNASLSSNSKEASSELRKKAEENEQLHMRLEEMELRNRLESEKQKQERDEKVERLLKELEEAKRELAESKKQKEKNKQIYINTLTTQANEIKSLKKERDREEGAQQVRLDQLEEKNKKLESELKEIEEELEREKANSAALTEDKNKLIAKLDLKDRGGNKQSKTIFTPTPTAVEPTTKIEKLQKTIENQKKGLENAEKEKTVQQKKLDDKNKENEELKCQLEQLRKSENTLTRQLEELKKELEEQKKELEEQKHENRLIRFKFDELVVSGSKNPNSARSGASAAGLSGTSETTSNTTSSDQSAEITRMSKNLERLRKKNEELRKKNEELRKAAEMPKEERKELDEEAEKKAEEDATIANTIRKSLPLEHGVVTVHIKGKGSGWMKKTTTYNLKIISEDYWKELCAYEKFTQNMQKAIGNTTGDNTKTVEVPCFGGEISRQKVSTMTNKRSKELQAQEVLADNAIAKLKAIKKQFDEAYSENKILHLPSERISEILMINEDQKKKENWSIGDMVIMTREEYEKLEARANANKGNSGSLKEYEEEKEERIKEKEERIKEKEVKEIVENTKSSIESSASENEASSSSSSSGSLTSTSQILESNAKKKKKKIMRAQEGLPKEKTEKNDNHLDNIVSDIISEEDSREMMAKKDIINTMLITLRQQSSEEPYHTRLENMSTLSSEQDIDQVREKLEEKTRNCMRQPEHPHCSKQDATLAAANLFMQLLYESVEEVKKANQSSSSASSTKQPEFDFSSFTAIRPVTTESLQNALENPSNGNPIMGIKLQHTNPLVSKNGKISSDFSYVLSNTDAEFPTYKTSISDKVPVNVDKEKLVTMARKRGFEYMKGGVPHEAEVRFRAAWTFIAKASIWFKYTKEKSNSSTSSSSTIGEAEINNILDKFWYESLQEAIEAEKKKSKEKEEKKDLSNKEREMKEQIPLTFTVPEYKQPSFDPSKITVQAAGVHKDLEDPSNEDKIVRIELLWGPLALEKGRINFCFHFKSNSPDKSPTFITSIPGTVPVNVNLDKLITTATAMGNEFMQKEASTMAKEDGIFAEGIFLAKASIWQYIARKYNSSSSSSSSSSFSSTIDEKEIKSTLAEFWNESKEEAIEWLSQSSSSASSRLNNKNQNGCRKK